MSPDPDRYRTPPEVASRFGVKPETVLSWIRSGELAAINLARQGSLRPRFRVSPEALALFEQKRAVVPRTPGVRQPRQNPAIKRFI